MKLTSYHRNAFVRAVIDDIPKIDYSEEIRTAVQNYALSKLPVEIKAIWRNNQLRGFLKTRTGYFGGVHVEFPCWSDNSRSDGNEIENSKTVSALIAKATAQRVAIDEVQRKVSSAIHSVTTLKNAKELLPEFAKYLPLESDPPSKFAPAVIANLSAELVALGWPKEGSK